MFCTKCATLRPLGTELATLSASRWNIRGLKKTIDDVPGPKGLPIIGTTLSLLMSGSTPQLHWYIDKRHKEYGSIFKESIGPVPCVFISDPKTIRSVFAHEGKYPIHVLPEAWTTYNVIHNVSRGIFFMDGEEWLHFRRLLNPVLLKGDQQWIEDCCRPAAEHVVQKIRSFSKRSPTDYPDMEKLLYFWSLEVIVTLLLGVEKYALARQALHERLKYLASNIRLVFEASSKLALIPSKFASNYRIPRWKNFEKAVTNALNSVADLVGILIMNHVKEGEGILGKLQGQMTTNELSRIVTDLVLAAGDTTAYSMEWILYLIGKNKDVQENLRKEIIKCNANNQNLTLNLYLKNTIRESLRLYPVAPFLTRILPEQATIQGYEMPPGSVLIMSIFTTGRDSLYFNNPLMFDPDRWSRDDSGASLIRSASLPFAIGARSCIGRKIAETQLQLTIANILSNFRVAVCNRNDINVKLEMVAVPSEKINFRFCGLN